MPKRKILNTTVNVGGTRFETTRETLSRAPYFQSLFRFEDAAGSTEPYYFELDCSPRAFEYILDLLRNPSRTIPEEYLSELAYYGLDEKESRTIMDNPTFMKVNDFMMVNWSRVKYIRYDKINDQYKVYLSERESETRINFTVLPKCLLHNYLKNKLGALKEVPEMEVSRKPIEFIKKDDSLFINWNQVKFVEYILQKDEFEIHFSSAFTTHAVFTVSANTCLHTYLKNKLIASNNTKSTFHPDFTKINDATIINWNSVKNIHYDYSVRTYLIYLSKSRDTSHKYFTIQSDVDTNDSRYLNNIFSKCTTKNILIAEDFGPNLIPLESDGYHALNWNHIKYVEFIEKYKEFRIYLSTKKSAFITVLDRLGRKGGNRSILYECLINEMLSSRKIITSELEVSPLLNLVGFNATHIINWNQIGFISYEPNTDILSAHLSSKNDSDHKSFNPPPCSNISRYLKDKFETQPMVL